MSVSPCRTSIHLLHVFILIAIQRCRWHASPCLLDFSIGFLQKNSVDVVFGPLFCLQLDPSACWPLPIKKDINSLLLDGVCVLLRTKLEETKRASRKMLCINMSGTHRLYYIASAKNRRQSVGVIQRLGRHRVKTSEDIQVVIVADLPFWVAHWWKFILW